MSTFSTIPIYERGTTMKLRTLVLALLLLSVAGAAFAATATPAAAPSLADVLPTAPLFEALETEAPVANSCNMCWYDSDCERCFGPGSFCIGDPGHCAF